MERIATAVLETKVTSQPLVAALAWLDAVSTSGLVPSEKLAALLAELVARAVTQLAAIAEATDGAPASAVKITACIGLCALAPDAVTIEARPGTIRSLVAAQTTMPLQAPADDTISK